MSNTASERYEYQKNRGNGYEEKFEDKIFGLNISTEEKYELLELFAWYGNSRAMKSKAYQEMKLTDLTTAKDALFKYGYCTRHLWTVYDVKTNYEVSTDVAHAILIEATDNTMKDVFDEIDRIAERLNLTKKE